MIPSTRTAAMQIVADVPQPARPVRAASHLFLGVATAKVPTSNIFVCHLDELLQERLAYVISAKRVARATSLSAGLLKLWLLSIFRA